MRINTLDLIRYGIFTDRSVKMPRTERDFHVIVGPNEAGKSTLRSAIQDLLYGIPKNTVHAFLHPMPDMRLRAAIEHGSNTLEFQRTKGNRQTLRTLSDEPLPESVIDTYIGATDRDFFSKMFGLNHERLVEGGHSILSASDDLGQILFQTAAGIGSLGAVREALEAEADKLWSKRRSGDRAYYIAADELERATAALKSATVRTKDWAKAYAEQAELEGAYAEARNRYTAIKAQRSLLERVRRVTPHLKALDDIAVEIAEIGDVPDLPITAAKTLADAERDSAAAQADIDRYSTMETEARSVLADILIDNVIRVCSAEVTELNERRLQYRAHGSDIARQQAEVDAQWAIVVKLVAELGWDASSEALVHGRMPRLAVRTSLSRLLREHGSLQQALLSAEEAENSKVTEIARANASLAELTTAETPTGLQAALTQAQKRGDFVEISRQRQYTIKQCEAVADKAFAGFGSWKCDVVTLRAMTVPSPDIITAFVQEQLSDDVEEKSAAARVQDHNSQIQQQHLEMKQFREVHLPVTREDVLNSRRERDSTWDFIKANVAALPAKVGDYEKLIVDADTIADTRHDKIQQAAELQSKQQKIQSLGLERDTAEGTLRLLAETSLARNAKWESLAQECGLPKVRFQAAAQWLEARKNALESSDALTEAKRALAAHENAVASASDALAKALVGLGKPIEDKALDVLMLEADRIVKEILDARGQRHTLTKQIADTENALISLAQKKVSAKTQFEEWKVSWSKALDLAGIGTQDGLGLVEGYLETIKQVESSLTSMQKTRAERIDAMRADLEAYSHAACDLAARVGHIQANPSADEIAVELNRKLAAANEAHSEAKRQQSALESAHAKFLEATSRLQKCQAMLAPLIVRATVTTNAALAEIISKSDKRRDLLSNAAASEKSIRDGGDGLSIEQLRIEVGAVDEATLIGEIESLTSQDESLVNELSELSARRQAATAAVDAIGGSADAAKAEGQRQEALAKMADAVERYLKVYTGAKLLKWSIEQYREAKQDPMLSLASTIFARLTLGSFVRLTVDFDSEPLKLQGRRRNGTAVDIEGMSDGTRDQLYLALRLAALNMHLDQAHVLPFIADDLFINFDDDRSMAGLEALGELSKKTQVIFLTHHEHLLPLVRNVFGEGVNVGNL